MQIPDDAGNPPVHFLRKGRIQIARTQTRFDVPHPDPAVKCRHGGGHDRRRIPLDQDKVRILAPQDFIDAQDHPCRQLGQGLVRLHDVQIDVRLDMENPQHVVEHLPVLGRYAHPRADLRMLLHRAYDGRKLYGFGTRPENDQYLLHQTTPPNIAPTLLAAVECSRRPGESRGPFSCNNWKTQWMPASAPDLVRGTQVN